MKLKWTIFLAALFLGICYLPCNAQTTTPKSKAQLIEFTNATANFTVPTGKTWTIHGVVTSFPIDDNIYAVAIKSINNILLTDISKNMLGNLLFISNSSLNLYFPIVLPENTTIELLIIKKGGGTKSLYDKSAFLNFTETEN